eukprot:Nk52_evm68s2192 gene=Nk52_evmTU68s2192
MDVDYVRDPCPFRILDDLGAGFAIGAIGFGGLIQGYKGYKNSPRGTKINGIASAIKSRAPVIGGNFAAWAGLFSTGECSLAYLRQKEDPWNAIMSGAMTGGILAARGGFQRSLTSAVGGGVILALIEGLGIVITRFTSDSMAPELPAIPDAPLPPKAPEPMPVQNSNSDFSQDDWKSQ